MDPLEKVMLDELEKFTYASSLLTDDEKEQLRFALLSNIDVFALSHMDMVRINPMENKAFSLGLPLDHPDGGRQLTKSRFHQRSKVPRMASRRSGGSKEGRQVASIYRLH